MARRIGVLINTIYSPYTVALLKGVERYCLQNNCVYYLFPLAHGKNSGKFDFHYETLLSFINANNIDGLIIVSTSFAHAKDLPEIIQMIKALPPLPKISIGLEIEGIPTVKIDYSGALKNLCEHLMQEHGVKNPVVMRSVKGNFESDERESVIVKTFSEHGIQIPESRILDGNFITENAYSSLSNFIRLNGADFDAVICLNDGMAIGTYKCLLDYGCKVPDEVRVTGFDNIAETISKEMNITTIDPQSHKFAFLACENICAMIDGKPIDANKIIELKPYFRGSCGCVNEYEAKESVILHFQQRGEILRTMDQQFYLLHHLLMAMQKPPAIEDLYLHLFHNLIRGEVYQFVLVFYDVPVPYEKNFHRPNKANVAMSFFNEDSFEQQNIIFNPNEKMFPPEIEQKLSGGYTLVPLFAKNDQFGYMLFKFGHYENIFYQILLDMVENNIISSIKYSFAQNENASLKNKNTSLEQYLKRMRAHSTPAPAIETKTKKRGFWPFSR